MPSRMVMVKGSNLLANILEPQGSLNISDAILIWLGHSVPPNSTPRDLMNHLSFTKNKDQVGLICSLRIYAFLLQKVLVGKLCS